MDRTAELYELAKAQGGKATLTLGKRDYVKSPAHTDRNVYGPGDVKLVLWPDGGEDLIVL